MGLSLEIAFNGSANLGSCPRGDAESCPDQAVQTPARPVTSIPPSGQVNRSSTASAKEPVSLPRPTVVSESMARTACLEDVHDTQVHLELNVDSPATSSLSLAGATPAPSFIPDPLSQHLHSAAFETWNKIMQQQMMASFGLPPNANLQQMALARKNSAVLQPSQKNFSSDVLSHDQEPASQPQQTVKRTAPDQPGAGHVVLAPLGCNINLIGSTPPKKRRKKKSSEGKGMHFFSSQSDGRYSLVDEWTTSKYYSFLTIDWPNFCFLFSCPASNPEKSESSQLHPDLAPNHAAFDKLAARKKHPTAVPCMMCMEPIFDKEQWSQCLKRCRAYYHIECLQTFRTAVGRPTLKCPKCSYCLLCKGLWERKIEVVYCSDEFVCGAELHRKCCSLPDDTCPRCFLVRSLH